MKRFSVFFLTLALALPACARPNRAGNLAVNPSSLNFGSLLQGQSKTLNFTLTAGRNTVLVSGFTFTGPYSTTKTGVFSLSAGQSISVPVTFTPTLAGSIPGSVRISSNAQNVPTVSLAGTGIAPTYSLSASPSSLDFGAVSLGGTNELVVTLTNTGNQSLLVTGSISGAAFNTAFPLTNVPPGGTASVAVNFVPVVTGTFTGSLVLTSTAPTVTIPLYGSCTQPVQHQVTLDWAAPVWDYTYPLSKYNVYRDGVILNTLDASLVEYSDFAVKAGENHSYVVTSLASDGAESAPSNTVNVTIPN